MRDLQNWAKNTSFRISFQHAMRGLGFLLAHEANLRRQLIIFILAVILAITLSLSLIEVAIIVLAAALVLTIEMINSSLEYIEDILHPDYHEAIRYSKDIAAGAVLFSSIIAVVVGVLIFAPPLYKLVG